MVMISSENVSVGDKLYDIVYGYGEVTSLQYGDITVLFNKKQRIVFDHSGSLGGVRRLYWHNPVVVEPPKNSSLWGVLVACIKPIYEHLK